MLSKKQIPNILTYARILAIPLMIALFMLGEIGYALLTFFLAGVTDFLDGYLARKWNLVTKFGAMLDQISDKLLICAALLCLVHSEQAQLVPVIIIIFREIFVSGLREFMGNERIEIPVSKLGKWKTLSQLSAVVLLMGVPLVAFELKFYADATLWLAAILSTITAAQYWQHVAKFI